MLKYKLRKKQCGIGIAKELEEYCNEKIIGILFMNIQPYEFQYIVDNPKYPNAKGSMVEHFKENFII